MSILLGSLYDQYNFSPLHKAETLVVLAGLTCKHHRGMVKDVMIRLGYFHYSVDSVLNNAPVKTNE